MMRKKNFFIGWSEGVENSELATEITGDEELTRKKWMQVIRALDRIRAEEMPTVICKVLSDPENFNEFMELRELAHYPRVLKFYSDLDYVQNPMMAEQILQQFHSTSDRVNESKSSAHSEYEDVEEEMLLTEIAHERL